MDQFIEESRNTLADLVTIKGSVNIIDPDVKITKVDPSKRMLRFNTFCFTFNVEFSALARLTNTFYNVPIFI